MTRLWQLARGAVLILSVLAGAGGASRAAEGQGSESLLSPQEALARITVPEGFRVSLFAAEPQVRQPIGITTDARGRLWVCENNTYSDATRNFDLTQHDRIVILEDTDADGKADRRTVFWDKVQKLTSVASGFGGVWVLCPPRLLFVPDRNGDDVPDAAPEVVLDGFDDGPVRHNIANGLRFGPDGWLYGRHGIAATSFIGRPGTPQNERTPVNCSVWRYHPTRRTFEVVCRGTTNSWGMDWDDRGELFFINTVIGHLWHVVPGAHYQRMYGEDFDPHLYRLIGQTADHYHWDTHEVWSDIRKLGVTATTDTAGGGHAHSGLMIYLGDNWPDRYRGTLFTVNYHGRRLNNDTLAREGASYVGRHAPDFLRCGDPWFRGLDLLYGADGGVYLSDWSDTGECHDNDGVHRESGRIYKITYGSPGKRAVTDVAAQSDAELLRLLGHKNAWYAREAQHVLHERAVAGRSMAEVHKALRSMFEHDSDPGRKLRALWCLYVTEGAPEAWLLGQLEHEDEHVRTWIIRLLVDRGAPSAAAVRAFEARVSSERSGLVLLSLASAMQRIAPADRWALAEGLAAHSEFASDPVLPLMVWYGLEPAVAASPARALGLAGTARMPLVAQLIARRLTEELTRSPDSFDQLVALVGRTTAADRQRLLLLGMAEALRGYRKVAAPASWTAAGPALARSADESVRRSARELAVLFGDGRAVEELRRIALSNSEDVLARRDAIRALVEVRSAGLVPLLSRLLEERDLGPDAVRGLAAFDDPGTPRLLLERYRRLRPPARAEAIVTLSTRPAYARALLDAVAAGVVQRTDVSTFQLRQIQGFPDPSLKQRVSELWPGLSAGSLPKPEQISRLKAKLDAKTLAAADPAKGRQLFARICASCHKLFGEGGAIGPDLTGAQRSSLDYLLGNIVDPSATLAADYRVSTLALADGRVIDGIIVGARTGPTLAVQTPTERLVIPRAEVEAIRESNRSLMPDGQLDVLTEDQVRDLVAYLMVPKQVPLPALPKR